MVIMTIDDPSGILNLGKPFINSSYGVFQALEIFKGWDQGAINYIQYIYSGSTTSNCPKD